MSDLEIELSRALERGDEGDFEGMADRLMALLSEHEDASVVHCWLGVAEHELGFESSAYERFKRCLALDPADPLVLATAGTGLARFDDPDAEVALRNAAITGPEVPFARSMYGAYLAREGFVEDAMGHLDAAAALAPDDSTVLLERGVGLALAGRHDEAMESFLGAWELDQEDGWSRGLAGLAGLEAGRLEEALGDLSAASALRPEDVEIALVTALTASAEAREDTAFAALESARMRASAAEIAELEAVEERLDEGPDVSREFLIQEFAPGLYRQRLMIRP